MNDMMEYLRGLLNQDPGYGQFEGSPATENVSAPVHVDTRRQEIDSRLSRAQEDYDAVQDAVSGSSSRFTQPDGTATWNQEKPMGLDALNAQRAEEGNLPLTMQGTEDALKYAKGQEALQRRRKAEQMAEKSATLKSVIGQQQAGPQQQPQNQNFGAGPSPQANAFPGLAPTQLTNPRTGQPVQAFARLGEDLNEPPQNARDIAWDRFEKQGGPPGGQNRWWTAMGPTQQNSIMRPVGTPGQTPATGPGANRTLHPNVRQWMSTGGRSGIPPTGLRQIYGRMQRRFQNDPDQFKTEWSSYITNNLPQQFHWMVK